MTLRIFLLGQFKLQANDLPIELPSRPAQSLMAYLALNAGVTHRREKLVGLFWPEAAGSNGRGYLRQALWRIRKSLESSSIAWEEHLDISDLSILFKAKSDYWLDAAQILKQSDSLPVKEKIKIIQLYRGELLPGFYEEWVTLERDRLQSVFHQKINHLLECLIEAKQWDEALKWGEEWIRLGYTPEPAFRALMRAYVGLGDISMASSTYQRCVRALKSDLNVDPSPETNQLHDQIYRRDTTKIFSTPNTTVVKNSLLYDEPAPVERSIFVTREHELNQLNDFLSQALSGQGRVVFITGEAGSGKTTLIHKFTDCAQELFPGLVITSGDCNAHTGLGDPYLPFREILGQLTGDIESRREAGAITRERARHLWETLPLAIEAVIETGPDLIGTFLPATALLNRAEAYRPAGTTWLQSLKHVINFKNNNTIVPNLQQSDLFEQYTRVLRTLAQRAGMVLILDDLQWADTGSIGLLFHLGRQLAGSPILIVGAYRGEEVNLGRSGERHPLEAVANEFQREFGEITINLEQTDSRKFLDALLDSEPNQLKLPFREMLHRQTQGHALFTIESLRSMQERGDLVLNQNGEWIEGKVLDWESLPARVEAVIAERISRLPYPLQRALQTASIQGEIFNAEVVAKVVGIDEKELIECLSSKLDRQHRLIRVERIQRLNDKLISSYRFRHILFQKYLYNSLDEVERMHLHEEVGTALEILYKDQEELMDNALQLARHFEQARLFEKSIRYLLQAGEKAIQLSANQEAISHLNKGLTLLQLLPYSTKRDQLELSLQIAFGSACKYQGPTPQAKTAINRAQVLCQKLGKTSQLSRVMGDLSIYHYIRSEYPESLECANNALHFAQQADETVLEAEAHWYLGFLKFCLGDYLDASVHLNQVISFYNPKRHHRSLVLLRGVDAGLSAIAYESCCLWCLGFPDKAAQTSQRALVLAKEFGHPFTMADIICYAGCMLATMRQEPVALMEHANALIQIADQNSLTGWMGMAISCHGAALAMMGLVEEAIIEIRRGIEVSESSGIRLYKPISLLFLAKSLALAGLIEAGMDMLLDAMIDTEQTGEQHWVAEIHRLQAEFYAGLGNLSAAENSLRKAIEIAQSQNAKSWELRAAIDLARLWQGQGKVADAQDLLEPIFNWFTEGFDTSDLKAAKKLLAELI